MIVCFEGAPAVGKSTTARALEKSHGYVRIPEVNELFGKDSRAEKFWYLERQAERWAMAQEHSAKGEKVILDGDVYQPVWFNAFYPNGPWERYFEVSEYFNHLIDEGRLGVPDQYVFFQLDERTRSLRERERSLSRGKTSVVAKEKAEYFQPLVEKQKKYFYELDRMCPNLIHFIKSDAMTNITELVLDLDLARRDVRLNGHEYLKNILTNLKSF